MTDSVYAQRRQSLAAAIGAGNIAIVAGGKEQIRYSDVHYPYRADSDLRYLTGFLEPDAVAMIAPGRPDGEFILFCRDRDPERELWDGRRAGVEGAVEQYAVDEAWPIEQLGSKLAGLLDGRKQVFLSLARHAGIQKKVMRSINSLKKQQRRGVRAPQAVLDLDEHLHEMRLFKQPVEITQLRRAAEVSAAAHCRAMHFCEPGKFEYEVVAELHHEFERHGMSQAYGSIVGGGENACILHYIENNAELKDGDLLLIDAGAESQGYCADITRSFPVNGKYSAEQKELYEIVLEAQLAAIAAVKPGADWNAPHRAAVQAITAGLVRIGLLSGDVGQLIEDEAYAPFYMHSTGHWLGMDVHDVGAYKIDGEWRNLEPGMTLTVEPGIYIAAGTEGVDERYWNIGIRIEDDVLVTEGGNEVLTSAVPKRIDEIESLMAEPA